MAYQLIFKDRWCYITPTPSLLDSNKLKSNFSYIKKNARHMINPMWGVVNLYDVKKHRFPFGLLSRSSEIINIDPDVISGLKKVPPTVTYGALREYQKDALNSILRYTNGIIKIPTGGGKTKVALQYIKNHPNKRFLILVPTLDLVKQWGEQVGNNTHVKTYAAIKKKVYIQQFDCVIFDECHHVAAKTLYKIGMNVRGDAEIFGLSATPLDRDDDNLKVEAVLGQIIYEISTRELIDLGYLCDSKIYYYSLSAKHYEWVTYQEVYRDYIIENDERNKKIMEIARDCNKPCLILVSIIEHGDMLYSTLKYSYKQDVVFLNGSLKKEDREDNNHDIIVATSIYDEGVDLPDLQTLIIAAGGKSAIKATQRIGRLLRPSPDKKYAIIHDFKDDCKWLKTHYKIRRKIFEKDFKVYDD